MLGSFTYRNTFFILLLGVFTYLYGLDSRFAPKNGDEYPYMHIVRMTADAGAWLPLQSEMDGIKNTKPPLVFWEGIASTSWGRTWTLLALRWPSVLYTGLTAFFLFFAVARFSGKKQTGLVAALVWLSFFATYRYGRPFLTDPPEVFWLSLPFFALLYWGKAAFESKLLFPALAGASFGMALLSKSFAYIVPAAFALSLFYWRWREWSIPKVLLQDLYKVILIVILSLAVFALWFALDPFPEAVWKEFVLGENAGKFEPRSSNYLLDLVRGGDSIWMLALTTLANAGLFTFVLISALMQCWRERRFISLEEGLLLLLILAFFIVFSLPSQRSGRYLLPVMPAFAALIAVYWDRLPLWGFRIALVLQLILFSALTWVGGNLQLSNFLGQTSIWNYSPWHWGFMGTSIALILLGIFNRERSKTIALAGCFLCYCALTSSLSPLEGSLGRYSQSTIQDVAGKDVWVPCDYRAKDEEYRLLLPGAVLHGYLAKDAGQINLLTSAYPLVAVQSPIGAELALCESCKVVGKRMEMRARHSDAEIQAILRGHIGEHLFVNEYLISTPTTIELPLVGKDACR
ncbi:MAG: glycosyl transferase [Polynucleobacter sp. 24-46-87]|jgi:4-amino-4-deoxy-L-arabinose transferase-like glycosyltransferase|uniref:ArnT family glycosyltransferase n=1 Tax=unclassified Polynucleobacter TaxID=2640945 RepID=UPI000BC3BEAD|nr:MULTISPECIES: phospholipid carrier-dependent glycosyltransferase [unclassified Polynucleobacter]OYY21740.1 MAG: glycosyl transferase [Polynucleobacter sp. 35-46-11]OZA14840.1 MAG: glycosyl transferase [Polynucleobacter sp. 24-46-87]OZA78410.1 MAG: glycosyl transferase [Polynucleobacter sp. 39-46-10]